MKIYIIPGQEATFHVDQIVPVTAGGTATLDNLALACVSSRTSPSAVANPPVLNSGGGELCFFAPCALGKSAGFLRAAQQAVGTDVAI